MDYKFQNNIVGNVANVQRASDGAFVPFDMGNRDCVQFLVDWKAGATVTNADASPAPYSDAAVEALGLTPPA